MKKTFLLLTLAMFTLLATAQKIEVKEDKANLGGAKNPVLTVIIYEADESTVEKAWKSLMKDYDAKVTTKDEIFADNAKITDMSTNTVDVYATTETKNSTVIFTVAFDLGGAFVSSSTHPDQYKVAEKLVKKFAVDISKEAVETKLEAEKKKQKELEKDLADLVKEKDKLTDAIADYNKKIAEAEKKIETNTTDQAAATKAVDAQTKVVETVQKKLDDIK